ncbi:MAG: hypothetical protein WCR04_09105 [Fibrobacteraceae bacterium]
MQWSICLQMEGNVAEVDTTTQTITYYYTEGCSSVNGSFIWSAPADAGWPVWKRSRGSRSIQIFSAF